MKHRDQLLRARRWVIKIGSALLTADGRGLDREALGGWADQIAGLTRAGCEVVLVSSGAVAVGMRQLGWDRRPHALHELQAAAAVGQMGLVQCWESAFQRHALHTALVLLTHDDLSDRKRYLNARSALCTLMRLRTVPVVNENDTVAHEELRLGDNDNLGALAANLVEADAYVILTDQQGLYDKDPRSHADARLIPEASADDRALDAMAGPGAGALGRGGMRTKIEAARRAAKSGTCTLIAYGRYPEVLVALRAGESVGTFLSPTEEPLAARKRWLAGQLQVHGSVILDEGAVRALRDKGVSLLPVGVKAVRGRFMRGELVACVSAEGREIARGLINYGAEETGKIMGRPSGRIEALLGYVDEPELIHRDNLVLI